MIHPLSYLSAGVLAAGLAAAFRVPIADTDALREVCSGMWGGKNANIELSFNPSSAGQVALVIYEWNDVQYLGVDTDNSVGGLDLPKTYICTTSAVRSGLCTTSQLGSFITTLPEGKTLDATSIYTQAVKFDSSANPNEGIIGGGNAGDEGEQTSETDTTESSTSADGADFDGADFRQAWSEPSTTSSAREALETEGVEAAEYQPGEEDFDPEMEDGDVFEARSDPFGGRRKIKRQTADDMIGSIADGFGFDQADQEGQEDSQPDGQQGDDGTPFDGQTGSAESATTIVYSGPIVYPVRKTGYYCVGIVPVTLVNSRSTLDKRQSATHAEYSGVVTFNNVFQGELPAAEYPKINFYLILSAVYFALGCAWAFLCVKHRDELLPMQYYISGTIVFLVIEMLANFAYYRYINKHGGGATSLTFLFVVSILNAARNSLSFFLLLIVSMGLSVVRQSLGSVMTKVRILTGMHFIFGVLYSVGTVKVELESASLILVMLLIFPLALTLTAFLMWIIVSLNSTIVFLQAHKQRMKLQMFQRLWRILIIAVIAIAAFFVVSSMSLSNRLDEDYAPNNWRYRWILLDGSLALIYLAVFSGIAWIWRPTANNRSFSMSQELAQDEAEADAEDYEFSNLEEGLGNGHRPLGQDDEYGRLRADGPDEEDGEEDDRQKYRRTPGGRGEVGEENTVFALDDSDEDEASDDGLKKGKGRRSGEYRDDASDGGDEDAKGK